MASALFFRDVGHLFMTHLMKLIASDLGIPYNGEFENFEDFHDFVMNERDKANGAMKDLLDSLSPVADKYDLSNISKQKDTKEYMNQVITLEHEIGTNLFNCVRHADYNSIGIQKFVFDRVVTVLDCEQIYMKNEYYVYVTGVLVVTVEHKENNKIGSVAILHSSDINTKKLSVSSTEDEELVKRYGIPVLLLVLLTIDQDREFWESFRFQDYIGHTALELFDKYTQETLNQQK